MVDKLNSTKELIVFAILTTFSWLVLSEFDVFEMVIEYLEAHEEYELDELLLLIIVFGLFSIFYSIRRVRESIKINKQLENLNIKLEEKIRNEIKVNQKREALLLEQSKMASMGEMIGNIAHQWRQPLNALGLVIQNIEFTHSMDELDDEFMKKSISKANLLTNNMSKTIDDFRFFYSSKKEKIDFNIFNSIEKSIHLIDASFEHNNINIITDVKDEVKVNGYINDFSQVIINILNNGKDALNDTDVKDKAIKIVIKKDNGDACVIINDNAGGISNNIIEKIFDPYFTTKEEGKGTGIGLYMSKMIIEQNMNGKLNVKNIDNGASFIIRIPLSKEVV